ncbi:MAG: DUF1592 domain-containing protein, partial [Gemmatimonadota bacterium]
RRYCATSCHSAQTKRGNLSLADFDVAQATSNLAVAEKVIRKLRAEMMPPPGSRRPTGDSLGSLASALEELVDGAAPPNPGSRPFQRLNRPEYERVVRDLLGVTIDAGDYLPLDTKSANFDNIADVQGLSPTLLEAYLNAAAAVARIAVGERSPAITQATYKTSPFASQHPWDHVEGTPYGARGGLVVTHSFPADGEYEFRVNVAGGTGTRMEDLDLSIDGERMALLMYERGIARNLASADAPSGADYIRSAPITVRAGQRPVSIAFVRKTDGPYEDLIRPHEWSRASNGTGSAGTTEPPAIMELAITGPFRPTGISETGSRRMIFTCQPASGRAAQRACAEQIITRLATRAYRRPLTAQDRGSLMGFYDRTAGGQVGQNASADRTGSGFEEGVRLALQAMLASPHFVFRVERASPGAGGGVDHLISSADIASRLSFFLWGSLPDERLATLARQNRLTDPAVLEREARRMLTDPRAEALSTRFAAQWLRLQDLEKVHPDAFLFPDFDYHLARAMQRETELFFDDLRRSDGSLLDLFTAEHTFVNERLARHYGIPGVVGAEFQKVNYTDTARRGLLGHGSILVQTSFGNRTSPVLRGKWVMEVLLGMPPPPPPPDIPDLEETAGSKDGKVLTTRERMELHRSNATCRSCHQYMDPLGLALDNFDVTGKLRFRENGSPLDTRGRTYDGTEISTPAELNRWLISRPAPLVRSFTENLMAYALGRRVEDYDQPTVRAIARDAGTAGFRLSSFVVGVVQSPAFRYRRVEAVVDSPGSTGSGAARN